LLQIENEFYGTIRPKRVIRSGERPLHALRERGVEYVEVRCMDLDPFESVGIGATTIAFLDVFLLHCLLADSPPDTPAEIAALSRNQHRCAERGREPGLHLERGRQDMTLSQWGAAIVEECTPIATALDGADGNGRYAQALSWAAAALQDPERLPSARVLQAMLQEHSGSHTGFVKACSERSRRFLMDQVLTASQHTEFLQLARQSLDEQRRLETAETVPFEEFRRRYLAPERLRV